MTAQFARRRRLARLGWATPALAVGATAVALGLVVGPTLGERVAIPKQIVLAAPSPTTAPRPSTSPPPLPTASSPPPTSTPAVQVVQPVRPVVSAPGDGSSDDRVGRGEIGGDS